MEFLTSEALIILGLFITFGGSVLIAVGASVVGAIVEVLEGTPNKVQPPPQRVEVDFFESQRELATKSGSSTRTVDVAEATWSHVKDMPYHSLEDLILQTLKVSESLGLINIKKQQKEGNK